MKILRKMMMALLVMMMVVTILPLPSLAEVSEPTVVDNVSANISCGENLTWSLSDAGVLTISGEGEMYDFSYSENQAPWLIKACETGIKIKKIVLSEKLLSIGDYAFASLIQHARIDEIEIPASVRRIGSGAFCGIDGLTDISIPNSVVEIGDSAFANCSYLSSVRIPGSVKKIGKAAFFDCFKLSTVSIGNGVQYIGDHAFYDNRKLDSIYIPGSVLSIGEEAFALCNSLTTVTFSEGLKIIAPKAFADCDSLTQITIPGSVETIGDEAFDCCSALENVTITQGVKEIGKESFYQCKKITSITLPESITAIGNFAFGHCTGLTDITLPDSEIAYGEGVFVKCLNLKSIQIPNSLTVIPDRFFEGCALETIIVPETVTAIGERAFYDCAFLAEITFMGNAPEMAETIFVGCGFDPQVKAYYPASGFNWTNDKLQSYGGNVVWIAYGEPEDTKPDEDNTSELELRQQIASNMEVISLEATVTLTENLFIPENITINIENGGSLTVPAGITLDVAGWITVYYDSSLIVEEGATLHVSNPNWRVIDVWGGTLDVTGAQLSEVYPDTISLLRNHSSVYGISEDMLYAITLVTSTQDVVNALAYASDYSFFELTVNDPFTLTESITIPSNACWQMWYEGNEVCIGNNVTFTCEGQIELVNNNSLRLENGGSLVNKGYIYVENAQIIAGTDSRLEVQSVPNNAGASVYLAEGGTLITRPDSYFSIFGMINCTPGSAINVSGIYEIGMQGENTARPFDSNKPYRIVVEWIDGESASISGIAPEHLEQLMCVSDDAELDAALKSEDTVGYGQRSVTIVEDMTLTGEIEIPKGRLLHMASSVTMTIAENGKIINHGEIWWRQGRTIQNNGILENNGILHVMGNCTNNGQIFLNSGSHTFIDKDGYVNNLSEVYQHQDAIMEINGFVEGNDVIIMGVAHEYSLGDVNHDTKINAKDATLILQKSVGVLKDSAKFCEDCAEVSGDGKLNAKDSTLILQFSVCLRDTFPAQK